MDASKEDEELYPPVYRKLSFSGGKKNIKKEKLRIKKREKIKNHVVAESK